jgi:hypothetical protein
MPYNYSYEDPRYTLLWNRLVPNSGKAWTHHGELLRLASRFYHDITNNGGCNIRDCYMDWLADLHDLCDMFDIDSEVPEHINREANCNAHFEEPTSCAHSRDGACPACYSRLESQFYDMWDQQCVYNHEWFQHDLEAFMWLVLNKAWAVEKMAHPDLAFAPPPRRSTRTRTQTSRFVVVH